ncbi:MAG TPA: peptidylprolyl isomerase [Saprospiraceae bacterium]|nr:peptidylprolyl isomerase [Saprospiraceae bacterium]
MMKIRILGYALLVCSLNSCFPPIENISSSLDYSLSDPIVHQIFEARDRRNSDSLKLFLNSEHGKYRLLSAESFGSFKDSTVVNALIGLLSDPIQEVRQAAVWSLGQIGHQSAEQELIKAFIPVDSSGQFLKTNRMILEALGKCGGDSTLRMICNVKSYQPKDTAYLLGQILAIYRFGLRGKFCLESFPRLVEYATQRKYTDEVRLMAAHCLQRFKEIESKPYFDLLKTACYEEKNPNVRMCLVTALARVGNQAALTELEELYRRGLDQRIQVNIVKGLQNFKSGNAFGLALKAIQNPSIHVASLGAQYFLENGNETHEEALGNILRQGGLSWQVKSIVYDALLRIVPPYKKLTHESLKYQIKGLVTASRNPYEKSAYLKCLWRDPKEIPYFIRTAEQSKDAIIKTTTTEAIFKSLRQSSFSSIYRGAKNPIYKMISAHLHELVTKSDVGSISIMAEQFQQESGMLKYYFKPDSSFKEAMKLLSLPRDIETYNDLEKFLAKSGKRAANTKNPDFNHPINWKLLEGKTDTIKVELETDKGVCELELYPKFAPGTVANFMDLIQKDFFKDKFIHRVVPNFVIQAGCPRGDGYGSLDYSIRTESSKLLNFHEDGILGMASSGPDTECSQFFISFSPAPHLDGRYTIFGKMTKGVDVLNIINVGDKILSVKLKT